MTCKMANTVEITIRTLNHDVGTTVQEHVILRGVNFNPLYMDMFQRVKNETGCYSFVGCTRNFNNADELMSIETIVGDIEDVDAIQQRGRFNVYSLWNRIPSGDGGFKEVVGLEARDL